MLRALTKHLDDARHRGVFPFCAVVMLRRRGKGHHETRCLHWRQIAERLSRHYDSRSANCRAARNWRHGQYAEADARVLPVASDRPFRDPQAVLAEIVKAPESLFDLPAAPLGILSIWRTKPRQILTAQGQMASLDVGSKSHFYKLIGSWSLWRVLTARFRDSDFSRTTVRRIKS